MPIFDITEKRPLINIFRLGGAYYFKYFIDDPELFRELVMKDLAWVEQAVAMGAVMRGRNP